MSSQNRRHPWAGRAELEAPSLTLLRKLKLTFLLLSLLATVAVHAPFTSPRIQALGHAFGNLVGQEHRWNMFSADPRGTSLDLWADLISDDGATQRWQIDRDRPGGDLAYYHWVKWMEAAVLLPESASLPGLAAWLSAKSPAQV
jgi:hypothetical protein